MQVNQLTSANRLVYATHKLVQTFQPTQKGSAVGLEFEDKLRAYITSSLTGCSLVSWRRDMGLGMGLTSNSGLSHELDLIVRIGTNLFVFELKHYIHTKSIKICY